MGGVVGTAAENTLHLVLQLKFALLEGDFFELFGFGEVIPSGQVVQFRVEVVVLGGELTVLLVGLQQLALQLFEVCRHFRLLEAISLGTDGIHTGTVAQDRPSFKIQDRHLQDSVWRRSASPSLHKISASSSGWV